MKKRKIRIDRLVILLVIVFLLVLLLLFLIFQISLQVVNMFTPKKTTVSQQVTEVKKVENVDVDFDKIVHEYLDKNLFDKNRISILVTDLSNQKQMFALNDRQEFFAGSVYKVALAMLIMDEIENNKLSLTDTFDVGNIIFDKDATDSYFFENNKITLDQLLEITLQHSDNGTSKFLFELLGGWKEFVKKANIFSNDDYEAIALSENNTTAKFLNDVLVHLYQNSSKYKLVIEHMKKADRKEYLDYRMPNVQIAQKYGEYGDFYNVIGIVYAKKTFSIVILTKQYGYQDAQHVMGDINDLFIEVFNK